jgi:uncharacterized protein (TIGR00730 family)
MNKSICIYCSSSNNINSRYKADADKLGYLLGSRGLNIVNGAGNLGLMKVVSDAALSSGGTVTGIIPSFMVKNDWCHLELTTLIETETMHERKGKMAELADIALALPGGFGTMEELLEIITWKQLGLFNKPVIILNTNNFYNPLLQMFRQATDENFIRESHSRLWTEVKTPEEALTVIEHYLLDISKV